MCNPRKRRVPERFTLVHAQLSATATLSIAIKSYASAVHLEILIRLWFWVAQGFYNAPSFGWKSLLLPQQQVAKHICSDKTHTQRQVRCLSSYLATLFHSYAESCATMHALILSVDD